MPEIIDFETLSRIYEELRVVRFQKSASGAARQKTSHKPRTPAKEELLRLHRANLRENMPLKEQIVDGERVLVLEI